MAGLVIRLIGVGFALIQAALLIRLLLPFVDTIPRGLRPIVVQIVDITDRLMSPFQAVAQPFDLGRVVELPTGVETFLLTYLDRLDPVVIVSMIAWGLIGAVVLLSLRILFRP